MSRITEIAAEVVGMAGNASWSSAGIEETLLVRVRDEDGREGIGESNAAPRVLKAFMDMPTAHAWSQNAIALLKGADPLEAPALWDRVYNATFYHGRRGLGIHALSALDIALYDLAGKALGRPVHALLGGARQDRLRPCATIFPGAAPERTVPQMMEEIERQFALALAKGFRAVKMEVLFGNAVSDRQLVDLIRRGAAMLPDDIVLAIDFGYRWRDWQEARTVLGRIAEREIYFAEAALQHDDLHGHALLSRHSPIRICGGECAATRWEIREWIEVGKVSVVQPGISRAGGFTEMRRIVDLCELNGVQVIPHSWASGITDMCNLHLQAASWNVPYVEFRSAELCSSALRRDLVTPAEPPVTDGWMALPQEPGLGIRLRPQ
jgi:L-alanine-DL-glutamate epimerase-like enolase superfamily enzyme